MGDIPLWGAALSPKRPQIPNTQQNTKYKMPRTKKKNECQIQNTTFKYLIPNTKDKLPTTKNKLPNTTYQIPNTEYQIPDIKYLT